MYSAVKPGRHYRQPLSTLATYIYLYSFGIHNLANYDLEHSKNSLYHQDLATWHPERRFY